MGFSFYCMQNKASTWRLVARRSSKEILVCMMRELFYPRFVAYPFFFTRGHRVCEEKKSTRKKRTRSSRVAFEGLVISGKFLDVTCAIGLSLLARLTLLHRLLQLLSLALISARIFVVSYRWRTRGKMVRHEMSGRYPELRFQLLKKFFRSVEWTEFFPYFMNFHSQ